MSKFWFYAPESKRITDYRPAEPHYPISPPPNSYSRFNEEDMTWEDDEEAKAVVELASQKDQRAIEFEKLDSILIQHFKEQQLFEQDLLTEDELEAVKTYITDLRDFPSEGSYPERPEIVSEALKKRNLI